MNERPSSQCTCDAVMGKEAKTHWIVPFFSVYIPFFVGFVFGFSQHLFLPSACPPPSLGITCLKFVWSAFAFATLTWHLSLFVGQQDLYLVRIVGWKAPNTLYHSLEEKLAVPNTEEKYSFWSRTYVPGCLQARFWFLAGKWGSVNHREIVSNWLAKPLYENWTYTSSRGYCQIFLL